MYKRVSLPSTIIETKKKQSHYVHEKEEKWKLRKEESE
jgi:hypothetical protein